MKCVVLIPLYKSELKAEEWASVEHNLAVLAERYIVRFIVPEGVDFSAVEQRFPHIEFMRVSEEWLGIKNGIAGYNRMMLSRDFYKLFSEFDYLLICQSDVWLFRDELAAWCEQGYDYVGAPWPRKGIYDLWPLRLYLFLRRLLSPSRRILRSDLFNKVGNGGLSLRRISSFVAACERYQEEIAYFLNNSHALYNEDVFWGLIPEGWNYPSADKARQFSIDLKPDRVLRLNGGRLPFGCHGWFRPERRAFWSKFIPFG